MTLTARKPELHIHTCWSPGTKHSESLPNIDYVLKSDYDALAAELAEVTRQRDAPEYMFQAAARIRALEADLAAEKMQHSVTIAEEHESRSAFQDRIRALESSLAAELALRQTAEAYAARNALRVIAVEAALQLIGNELSLHADKGPAGEAFRALLNPTLPETPMTINKDQKIIGSEAETACGETELAVGCHRSHPHEDMDAGCQRLTEIARTNNALAREKP